jgi:DNA polymerase-4
MPFVLSDEELTQHYARRIIHVDMDAFYASVEQRDDPQLRGKPVIVGGRPNSRGVVAACSYEAREFGVHSAMPTAHAARLCPHAEFLRPNMHKYKEVSGQIHEIFRRHSDIIEPLAFDEAYLDVSGSDRAATDIAKSIKRDIRQELFLNASAGVSYNKFLAKIASEMRKPDGFFVIRPSQAESLVAALEVRKFHGVGPVTAKKMAALGIQTGADIKKQSVQFLQRHFGSHAEYYYQIARGIDTRHVKSDRKRVSVGSETTYAENLESFDELLDGLSILADKVGQSLQTRALVASTLTIKIKFADFQQFTRAKTLDTVIDFADASSMRAHLAELLTKVAIDRPVRLLGVSASKLQSQTDKDTLNPVQLDLSFL